MEGRRSPAIGIHLGSRSVCVAAAVKNDRVEVLSNESGNRTTPFVVAFTEDERFVGEGAYNQRARNPKNTVYDIMRLIGHRFDEESIQRGMRSWPFRVVAGPRGAAAVVVEYRGEGITLSPEELLSMVIKKLKSNAESFFYVPVRDAVVTVPGHFNYSQRRATRDAATNAGLNVLLLIDDPIAAAISYGLGRMAGSSLVVEEESRIRRKKHHLVFDFGGRELNVGVVSEQDGRLKVKAMVRDDGLGGDDLTTRMVIYFAQLFLRKHGADITSNPRALGRLRDASGRAKVTLSEVLITSVEIECFYQGEDFSSGITRGKFEELVYDVFEKCMDLVERCLRASGTDRSAINEVILVGGSTKIPRVREMLKWFFGKENLHMSIDPDEVLAHGAAIQAAMITRAGGERLQDLVLFLTMPISVGVETWCGEMTVIVPQGTPLPAAKRLVIGVGNESRSMTVRVFKGEAANTGGNHLLSELKVDGIEATPGKMTRLDVDFSIDVRGVLAISVLDERGELLSELHIGDLSA